MARARAFVFTVNNYTEEQHDLIKLIECSYLIVGKEVGEAGTPHLQGYIYFKSMKTIKQVSALIPHAHIELAKGDAKSNRTYCSKEGSFYEKGESPKSQKEKGEGEVKRWELALTACRENRLEDIPADICGRHLKSLEYASSKLGKRKLANLDHEVRHLWYHGPPGTGKSRKAREDNPDAFIKDPNTMWWDGYNNEDVVIIDDFDKYQVKQGGDMKRWLDIYPFQAPVKGGYLHIRPKQVIVTSNYTPSEIWEDKMTQEAIMRRVLMYNFDTPFNRKN